jgi:hypothetical protein
MLERKKSDSLIGGHLCVYLVYFYPLRRFLPRQLCLQCTASFTYINSVIEHTSIFWLQAMPSCVRAPCRTSESREASSVRHPLVHTLALTLIRIARVVLSVFIRQIFLISIVCCCIRRCMSPPLTKFLLFASPEPTDLGWSHRYQAPGQVRHFHGRLCWSTCYSLPREIYAAPSLSQILNIHLSHLSSVILIIPYELIRRLQLYLVDA